MSARTLAGVLASLLVLVTVFPTTSASETSGLHIDSFALDVSIRDGLAVTTAVLRATNPDNVSREAVLDVPLSPNAVLTNLTLRTHNDTLVGVVLERFAAQTTYNASKDRNETAALLQSAGKGHLTLSLNVAPLESIVLSARYIEPLPITLGRQTYSFPLNLVTLEPLPVLVVDVELQSATGWANASVHGLPASIAWDSAGDGTLRYEASDQQPAAPFQIILDPVASGYASHFIASDRSANGSFVLQILPPGSNDEVLPLDVVFVLDHSGSMNGAKIVQARQALETILGQLRTQDHFGLVRFSGEVERYHEGMESATPSNVDAAQDWVRGIEADGSTDIEAAVSAGLGILGPTESAAVPTILLITDGLPTSGITDPKAIIDSLKGKNQREARLHVVGIGLDQDNAFLSELAASTRGFYQAVAPTENVDAALASFFDRVGTPLLKDVRVSIDGLDASDVQPQPLPDVYEGSQLLVAGRADTRDLPDVLHVHVTGRDANGPASFEIPVDTTKIPDEPDVDRLWARLKAGSLERALALGVANESAARAQLLELGLVHQIETTETAWLIVQAEVAPAPWPAPSDLAEARDALHGATPAIGTTGMLGGGTGGAGGNAKPTGPTVKKTPGPEPLLVIAALVAAAFVTSRRRERL